MARWRRRSTCAGPPGSSPASSGTTCAFESRIAKVLRVAAFHGHEALVLGAWGCGAFGNDPALVAHRFREALTGPFAGVFSDVVFAITDAKRDRHCLGPFEAAFAD